MHTASKKTTRSRNRKKAKRQQLVDAATVLARAWKAHLASRRHRAATVLARAWRRRARKSERRSRREGRRWRRLKANQLAVARECAATTIARAWRRRRTLPKDPKDPVEEMQSRECTVCFADFSPHTPRHALPCGHIFCGDCARAAIQSEACFTCREKICQSAKAIRLFL